MVRDIRIDLWLDAFILWCNTNLMQVQLTFELEL